MSLDSGARWHSFARVSLLEAFFYLGDELVVSKVLVTFMSCVTKLVDMSGDITCAAVDLQRRPPMCLHRCAADTDIFPGLKIFG